MRRALAGDREALDEVLARYLPRLRAFVRLQTGARIRAEESTSDLVQSVCRHLLEDLPKLEFRGEEAFRGWLFTTAVRKILKRDTFYTRAKRDVRREVGGDVAIAECYRTMTTPSADLIRSEEIEEFERAFDRLDAEHREIISLVRVAGMSHAEAGEKLGKTEGASRVLLHRALARLATILETE